MKVFNKVFTKVLPKVGTKDIVLKQGVDLLPTDGLLFKALAPSLTDSIGKSISEVYPVVEPDIQSIISADGGATWRPAAEIVSLAYASPLLNNSTMIGSETGNRIGVVLYPKGTSLLTLIKALRYFGKINEYFALSDASLSPVFVEGWAQSSFMGVNIDGTPGDIGLPLDAQDQPVLAYTISGVAGETTVTIESGDSAKFTRIGMVVKHDDDTYGLYGVANLVGSVFSVFPPVRSTITSKVMVGFTGLKLGQHLSESGYKALAGLIYNTTERTAYRGRFAAKWDSLTGAATDWAPVGGATSGNLGVASRNDYISDGATIPASHAFISRGRRTLGVNPISPRTGKGASKTFALGGATGHLEMFVSCALLGAGGEFRPFNVTVTVDGVELHNVNYTGNDGLQRIIVPYASASSGTITCTKIDDLTGSIYIGDTTWWSYEKTPLGGWTGQVIDKNKKTVVIGDSWTTYYSDALGAELQALITADGGSGTVVGHGVAGTTAEDGLAAFDTTVTPESPGQVVICYFTNDHNEYGTTGYDRWALAMYRIGLKCQAIGARPIFIMPLPTASLTQSIDHGGWADELSPGII